MMKRCILLVAILILIVALASCSGKEPAATTASDSTQGNATTQPALTTAPPSDLVIAEGDKSEYVIVYPADDSGDLKEYADSLANAVKTNTGAEISVSDSSAAASGKEIILGKAERPESADVESLIGDKDYVIAAVNEKLVLYAKDEIKYKYLINALVSKYMRDGSFKVERDLVYASNKEMFDMSGYTLKKNSEITFSIKLSAKSSSPGIFFGSENSSALYGYRGYGLTFTSRTLKAYNQRDKRYDVYEKIVRLDTDKWYDVTLKYNGQIISVTVANDPEGIEPWPEFEVYIGRFDGVPIFFTEDSGNGLYIKNYVEKELAIDTSIAYKNSLFEGADPDIICHEGTYYAYVTSTGYDVYSSKDLINWKLEGKSLPTPGWEGQYDNYWAPDVEYINGKFYMAVSFGEAGLGIATSDSPTGPFVCQGDAPLLKKTIDGHIFVDDDGKVYLYYTSWQDRNGNGRSYGIYGVQMSDDLINPVWSTEKLIFKPTEPWESTQNRGGVVEAPFMLKHNGLYYLVYSGSHFEADYAVGYATSTSPLGTYKKYIGNPILVGTADVTGTGHCSIVDAPDGTMVMIYHIHSSPTKVGPRKICIDPIRFVPVEGGEDILEAYGPTVTQQEASWLK